MAADIFKEYLIHSYLYYVMDKNIISDGEFDDLCVRMNKEWKTSVSYYKIMIEKIEGPNSEESPCKGCHGNEEDFPDEIKRAARDRYETYIETAEALGHNGQ